MRRRKKLAHLKGDEWLVTYSDLVTLLLVFFVLLYSFSKVDIVKFQRFIASFQGVGILNDGPAVMEQMAPEGTEGVSPAEALTEQNATKGKTQEMYEMVSQYLEEQGLSGKIDISVEEDGIALDIKEKILFDSGKAVLKPEARELLDQLTGLFKRMNNQVSVEGHTDNRSINTVQYPTNWELSVDRAAKVVRYLTEQGGLNPKQFIAVGYGEYSPVVPNDSPENQAMNRRVIMRIKTKEMSR